MTTIESTVQEFRTEISYWGGEWKPVTGSSDIPLRIWRGESLEGIRIRTSSRTVTTTAWHAVTNPVTVQA